MNELKFCPNCGAETLKWDGLKWYCDECGFTLYHNVAAAVAVIIRCGNELLLTRRTKDPGSGKLDLAGGFVDPEESAEQACSRELYEELQLKTSPQDFKFLATLPNVYHYKNIDYNTLDLFFEINLKEKPDLKLDKSEVAEIVWLKEGEINIEDIAFESQRKFFRKYFNQ